MNAPMPLALPLAALAEEFGYPLIGRATLERLTPAFDRLPLAEARRLGGVLFRHHDRYLAAIADPFDGDLQRRIEARAGDFVAWRLTEAADLDAYLRRHEASARALESVPSATPVTEAGDSATTEISLARIGQETSPVVKLVDSTLHDALLAGASDIHLEATPAGLAIRYRLDGVLETVRAVAGRDTAEQAVSRLKVMAALDIAERRVPQDGRFRIRQAERRVDVRVSVMPSIHGEDAVLRLLDKRALAAESGGIGLPRLGFDEAALAAIRELAAEPYGMLLVTGPTGSGKTTTLYAVLSEIHDGRDKIVTIEDPVEYELPGVLQIPVNEKKGLTFARGLRSILRHDPDKIMVGEIRDPETAEIAVQSALTGHLVLSTVHANNVFDVFSRFAHMGIDPYALTSAVNGIWAQRLLRVVCPHCAAPAAPTAAELAALGLRPDEAGDFRRGAGCPECRGTGFKGRRAIAEILVLDDELRGLIAGRASLADIKAAARRRGTRSLREAALDLARRGLTPLEEVRRVTLRP